jgi:D-3-phosphoglycerate dehydrogenase
MSSSQTVAPYRVLLTEELADEGLDALRMASDVHFELRTQLTRSQLLDKIHKCDALIVRSGTNVDHELIEAATKLRVIGRAGVGIDNIDVVAASNKGILVMNAPEVISIATAEHTMALILAASRHIVAAHLSLIDGQWKRASFTGQQLSGKNLGIIGFGRIGRGVSERALAFGMFVSTFDPYVSGDIAEDMGIEKVDLDRLLADSDYISLHAAKTPETANIIGHSAFRKMKSGVILVNVSRGGLVDESALLEALESGTVRAAAIDVYESEPPLNNSLIGHPKVTHTPHLGASTVEAQRGVATEIVRQVLDALRGDGFRNVINISVVDSDSMRI